MVVVFVRLGVILNKALKNSIYLRVFVSFLAYIYSPI